MPEVHLLERCPTILGTEDAVRAGDEGDAGADATLPGFTCAGGAGSGSLSLSLKTSFITLDSDNVSLHAVQGGKAMTFTFTEHNGTDHIMGAGILVEDPLAPLSCDSGPDRTVWTGRLALEALQDTRPGPG